MENVKIILDNGVETNVNGIFFVFNSKYYFIYTLGETENNEYVKLYVVQVCKEVQNTPNGPMDTGYLLGMEISNPDEWNQTQQAITQIVEDKKGGTHSAQIQYLPMSMLVNLKVTSSNKFKLMRHIVEDNFGISISLKVMENVNVAEPMSPTSGINNMIENSDEVIIDYRSRFFEEQEKTKMLEEQIRILNEKLENIKNIIE